MFSRSDRIDLQLSPHQSEPSVALIRKTADKQVGTPPHFFQQFLLGQNFVAPPVPFASTNDTSVSLNFEKENIPPKMRVKAMYRKSLTILSENSILGKRSGFEAEKSIQPVKKKRKITAPDYESGKKVLLKFFLDNISHPYPKRREKEDLSEESGLSIGQVNDFFTNFRKRYWLPSKRLLSGQTKGRQEVLRKILRSRQGKKVHEALKKISNTK